MRGLPSDLPDAWLEIAEYTLDASRVVLVSENFPVPASWHGELQRMLSKRQYSITQAPPRYKKRNTNITILGSSMRKCLMRLKTP